MPEVSRFRPFDRFETDVSRGAQLWRTIGLSKKRIQDACSQKGIKHDDMLWRQAIYISDSKHLAFNLDEELQSDDALRVLNRVLEDMHNHEARVCARLGVPCSVEAVQLS